MFQIEPISRYHHRDAFRSGKPALDLYLQMYARQNDEKNLAKTYVITDTQQQIVGYYTLSACSIEFERMPEESMPYGLDYPIPAANIAQLAVDSKLRHQGLGTKLLLDALQRIQQTCEHMAIKVVLADAIDMEALQFYRHFGFIELPGQPGRLFLPIESVQQLLTNIEVA